MSTEIWNVTSEQGFMACYRATLPEVLRYVDDLSVAQVGREMGLSTHAAESLLARATRRLRNQEVRDA